MRVFSGTLATETNTFAPMPTGLSSFHDRGYYKAGQHPDQMSFFAGPLWAARLRGREMGWTLVEGMVAGAQPSGTTTRHAYETLRDELLADLQAALPVSHGFPWGDVPDMGTKVLVYSDARVDSGAGRGAALARRLADELSAMRHALDVPMPDIDEALDQALAIDGGPLVLADGADNPGGGAPGDSTFILRRLLERGIRNACIGPLWDPVAARIAFDAGEGATLMLRIGGKIGPLSGDPLDLRVTVKALRRELSMTGLSNTPTAMGDSALVECNGIDILLCSLRNQAMGTDLFTNIGVDLGTKKIIVVKSSQHFYASFSKVAKQVIYVAAPGVVTVDLKTLPYKKIRRPKWPID